MTAIAVNYQVLLLLLETMPLINYHHVQQRGSVLILVLVSMSTLLFLVLASVERTVQHIHLLSNYRDHSDTFINAERCLTGSLSKLSKLPDARFWSKNTESSSQGLFNRVGRAPFNIKIFDWNIKNTGMLNNNCRYIIEYLGITRNQTSFSTSVHILRVSIQYLSIKQHEMILQAIISIPYDRKELPSLRFKYPPTLQQWIQIY